MVCGLAGRVGPGVRESQPTGHRRPGCALRRNWRESRRMAKTTVAAGHPGPRGRVYREPRLGRERKGQRLPLHALPQRRHRPGCGESTRRGRRDSRAQVPERVHGATSRAPFGAAFFFLRGVEERRSRRAPRRSLCARRRWIRVGGGLYPEVKEEEGDTDTDTNTC